MSTELSLKEIQKEYHGTFKSYLLGFFASLLLTLLSFSLVVFKGVPEHYLVHILIALAVVQAVVQLLFFLHVGEEAKPRWETIIFYFMILVVLIIVVGSLWIMYDLDQRVMTMPKDKMNEMRHHD